MAANVEKLPVRRQRIRLRTRNDDDVVRTMDDHRLLNGSGSQRLRSKQGQSRNLPRFPRALFALGGPNDEIICRPHYKLRPLFGGQGAVWNRQLHNPTGNRIAKQAYEVLMPSAKVSGIAWYAVVSHPIATSIVQTGRERSFEGGRKGQVRLCKERKFGIGRGETHSSIPACIGQLPIMRGR